ncbi:MAG: TetR/AcrR family transcriptional regulator [Chloroflexota bacterium]
MTLSKRDKREKQILDAASALFVRYGYDKTTVADIAREAGVSKGAIYLHVENKQELLEKLIVREMQTHGPGWLQALEDDPDGGTIAGFYRGTLRGMNSSPFMQAIFKQDGRVFGTYLRQPDNIYRRLNKMQSESHRIVLARRLQEAGAIRSDISADVIAYVMAILAFGLVTLGEMLGDREAPSIEAVIEGIALIMDKGLTPDAGGNPEATKRIVIEIYAALYAQYAELLNKESTDSID